MISPPLPSIIIIILIPMRYLSQNDEVTLVEFENTGEKTALASHTWWKTSTTAF